jgi:molybdate transport system regulatory protein
MARARLSTAFTLERDGAGSVGASRIALLQAIHDHGSITAAAKAVGLSYKAAWDAVRAMNNLFDRPVVRGRPGGAVGGASEVTELGEALIAAFRFVDDELARVFADLGPRLERPRRGPYGGFLWSLSMKTSARNALAGTVVKVTDGSVNAEVSLDIGEGQTIVAVVTSDSIDDLGLRPGRRALALIKSSFVILVPGSEPPRTSARNCLKGVVTSREDGTVNSEIVLTLSPAKTLTATITRESADELGLDVGVQASALIKASHIVLVIEE